MLMHLNLHNVRRKVLEKLVEVMDRNGDGVDYEEFCNWLKAEDAKDLKVDKPVDWSSLSKSKAKGRPGRNTAK